MEKLNPKKRKEFKEIALGKVYITASFNNTLVNLTDDKGNAICASSSGSVGFKGSRKATPYAATSAVESVTRKAREHGVKEIEVFIKGPGVGRDAAIRALKNSGLRLLAIADITPIPHNGPRPRKRRRA